MRCCRCRRGPERHVRDTVRAACVGAGRAAALALLLAVAPAGAVERPLWEAGVGAVGGSFESWPASSERTALALVVPWFVYRGEVLRVQDGSVTARVVDLRRLVLDLGVDAAPAPRDRDGGVREGMPKLGWMLEAGPRLRWRLDDPDSLDERWFASVAARAALSVRGGARPRGGVVSPSLDYLNRQAMGGRFTLSASLAAEFATSSYARYYYDVPEAYATATRPAYAARAGYLGTRLYASMQYRIDRTFSVYAFLDGGLYRGAANEDSPLAGRERGVSAGIGVIATLGRSDRLVTVPD